MIGRRHRCASRACLDDVATSVRHLRSERRLVASEGVVLHLDELNGGLVGLMPGELFLPPFENLNL